MLRVEDQSAPQAVHRMFEAQASRTPSVTALLDQHGSLTFMEVNERANRIAHLLVSMGIESEARVGVFCERSSDMVIALLAVLKAGGAYVPLDPNDPMSHIEHVLADASLELVLTSARLSSQLANATVRCVEVDNALAHEALPSANLDVDVSASSALFVLYTSGSTGSPKGVVGEHGAIRSRLLWAQEVYPYRPGETACARTTLGFVDSIAEIFAPLAFGVPLLIIGAQSQGDLGRMLVELAEEEVTRIVVVPSLLSVLLDMHGDLAKIVPRLHYWFIGGEAVPVALVARFQQLLPGRKLINIYGATELSGDATYFDFDAMPDAIENAPIGTPIRGVHARVLDRELREVKGPRVGEICVSGACLARGYLNQPGMTNERFVPNPFPEGGRLYRTGDLGRRLSSGDIECLGRSDQQVKIRGMRVELRAVEAGLLEHDDIDQVVVVAQPVARTELALIAFYTSVSGAATPPSSLRAHMTKRSPAHSLPSRFVHLQKLPINRNGKVDREALSGHDHSVLAPTDYERPASDLEERIAVEWCELLGLSQISRFQNFQDLGGNSLHAARVVATLRDKLHIEVTIRAVFENPSIAELAAYVCALAPSLADTRQEPLRRVGGAMPAMLPLSRYQLPFWLFYALTGEVSAVCEVFSVPVDADLEVLQQAYSDTVFAFDALWMTTTRRKPVQRVAQRRPCTFRVVDRRADPDPTEVILQHEADLHNSRAFDLQSAPLILASLILIAGEDGRLFVKVPHALADMSAMEIFRERLQENYLRRRRGRAPRALPVNEVSLRDLIEWEVGVDDHAEAYRRDAEYWSKIAVGPVWNRMPNRLFTNKLAGAQVRAFSTRCVPLEVEDLIHAYGRERRISTPIALVGALYTAIARVCGLSEVTLLLMLEKRERAELRTLFASLASFMRVCHRHDRKQSLDELVKLLGDQLMQSYTHTDHLMHDATLSNDFWVGAPRSLVSLAKGLSNLLSRYWKGAGLRSETLSRILFSLVPLPDRMDASRGPSKSRRDTRRVVVCLNILPEVYSRSPPTNPSFQIQRNRTLEHILKPGDFVVNTDRFLDNTLQVHLTRESNGVIAINLYGGGMDQEALDEINDQVTAVLADLAGGRASHTLVARPD